MNKPRNEEIHCDRCGMEATTDRLDVGVTDDGEVIYICPVCGNDLGEVICDVDFTIVSPNHPSIRGREVIHGQDEDQ